MSAGAAFYGNESIVGAGLSEFIAAGKRPELFITSKVWNTHHKPADSRYGVSMVECCWHTCSQPQQTAGRDWWWVSPVKSGRAMGTPADCHTTKQ